jgi:hypothetical protein
MDDYHRILRKAGWVLILGGLAEISYTIHCIANQQHCASGGGILGVVAGIFLLKGSLKASRIISWFTAFFSTFLRRKFVDCVLTVPV